MLRHDRALTSEVAQEFRTGWRVFAPAHPDCTARHLWSISGRESAPGHESNSERGT